MNKIATEITGILYNEIGINANDYAMNTSFLDLGLDSIALMEFQFVVAKHYGIDEGELNLIIEDSLGVLEHRLLKLDKGIGECAIPLS